MKPTTTKSAAKIIARNAAQELGEDWMHDVQVKGDNHVPTVYHRSRLIGLHHVTDTGWVAAIGLTSALTEGEKKTENTYLMKCYSAVNRSPRRAVIELIDRSRRLIGAIQPQFKIIDEINRAVIRLEDPTNAPADLLTFDQWWEAQTWSISDIRAIAETAWQASKENK